MLQAESTGGRKVGRWEQLLQLDCDLYCIRTGECKDGMCGPVNNARQEEEEEEKECSSGNRELRGGVFLRKVCRNAK